MKDAQLVYVERFFLFYYLIPISSLVQSSLFSISLRMPPIVSSFFAPHSLSKGQSHKMDSFIEGLF
jgi:hypothetical protein